MEENRKRRRLQNKSSKYDSYYDKKSFEYNDKYTINNAYYSRCNKENSLGKKKQNINYKQYRNNNTSNTDIYNKKKKI